MSQEELIVDNFAGGGGASTGIELALGRCVDIAVNHDSEAIALHAANHPKTQHFCEDVFKVDPREVTHGRPVGFAWFSPDCKDFSKAKGGKPRSKKIRGLAWVMVKWAATVRPRVMALENVEEFQTWGPLLEDGTRCPLRKGKTFQNFIARLRNLGYAVEWKELRACDYGAPTIRKRLFLIARCDGQPIIWPEPTHARPGSEDVESGRLKPWRTAAECIDWTIPCPSIFDRKKPLAEATQRRIARGIRKFVLQNANPFIVKVNHSGCEYFRGQPLDEPLQTVTAKHGYGLAAPVLTEHANGSSQRVFDPMEPLRTQCAEIKGGHFAMASAFLAKHFTGVIGSPLPDPVHTVTATDHNALVAASLVRHFGESVGQPVDAPAPTVMADGLGKTGLIAANLINTANSKTTGRGPNAWPTEDPLRTITSAPGFALAASHISKLKGTCKDGHPADEPLHTVQAGGNHYAEVRAFLIKYYGEGGQDQPCDDPMHTIPTRDRIGLVTVGGQEYVISDIGMRMLEPKELYAAQGFPTTYIIAPVVKGRTLPKHAQVRMCGNSVCPPLAQAITAANVPELSVWDSKEKAA